MRWMLSHSIVLSVVPKTADLDEYRTGDSIQLCHTIDIFSHSDHVARVAALLVVRERRNSRSVVHTSTASKCYLLWLTSASFVRKEKPWQRSNRRSFSSSPCCSCVPLAPFAGFPEARMSGDVSCLDIVFDTRKDRCITVQPRTFLLSFWR